MIDLTNSLEYASYREQELIAEAALAKRELLAKAMEPEKEKAMPELLWVGDRLTSITLDRLKELLYCEAEVLLRRTLCPFSHRRLKPVLDEIKAARNNGTLTPDFKFKGEIPAATAEEIGVEPRWTVGIVAEELGRRLNVGSRDTDELLAEVDKLIARQ